MSNQRHRMLSRMRDSWVTWESLLSRHLMHNMLRMKAKWIWIRGFTIKNKKKGSCDCRKILMIWLLRMDKIRRRASPYHHQPNNSTRKTWPTNSICKELSARTIAASKPKWCSIKCDTNKFTRQIRMLIINQNFHLNKSIWSQTCPNQTNSLKATWQKWDWAIRAISLAWCAKKMDCKLKNDYKLIDRSTKFW